MFSSWTNQAGDVWTVCVADFFKAVDEKAAAGRRMAPGIKGKERAHISSVLNRAAPVKAASAYEAAYREVTEAPAKERARPVSVAWMWEPEAPEANVASDPRKAARRPRKLPAPKPAATIPLPQEVKPVKPAAPRKPRAKKAAPPAPAVVAPTEEDMEAKLLAALMAD